MPLRSRSLRQRLVGLPVALCVAIAPASVLVAQIPELPPGQRPTPEQARQILQTQPELVRQLRERLQGSGLTPDQIRARLRAEGYPEELLDAYLTGFDTTQVVTPSPATLPAVRALGILSVEQVDSLAELDSARALSDSARRVLDSLSFVRLDSLRQDSLADSISLRGGRLKRFGLDVFRRATTRFEPARSGPVDENYHLGAGDVLVLIISGDVELTHTLEVNREGFIVIPQVGQVYVSNLTLHQLEDLLYTRLGRVYSGIRRTPNARTRFIVTVAKLRNIQVYVAGDVVRPGAYQMSAAGTVLTGLYAAGGPTESGSFRRIVVRRGNAVVDTVDAYDYLLQGINRSDVRLEAGDVVFVPIRGGLVSIRGRVVRPAVYEIKANETLREVIAAAGGFEVGAIQSRVQIHRALPAGDREPRGPERVVIDVKTEDLATGTVPAFPMTPGDSVIVFAAPRAVRKFVIVRGNVWTEGQVGFTPGMRLSEAIRLAGGPKPDVYLEQVLVSRLRPDSSRIQLRSAFADTTGKVSDDFPLADGDEIRVFSRSTFRERPWITVTGAVRRSGRIPYREGMTLQDAVLLADGLTPDAAREYAEIARLPTPRPTGALAETVRVPIDSAGTAGQPVPLRPYDNVLFPRQGGYDLQRLVYVSGQVKAPGRYALTSKTERLSDLLERAGGLTEEAYAGGIEFYRRENVRLPARNGLGDTLGVEPLPPTLRARVGVDLPRVLKDAKFRDNLVLSGGDSIHIPEFDPVVTVQGAVNAPGPVTYTPGKNLDWYVKAAGGYAQSADRKRPYVTQPDGHKETVGRRFLLADDVPRPRPGARILVPERRAPEPGGNAAQILGVVASVIASLTTIIVVLR